MQTDLIICSACGTQGHGGHWHIQIWVKATQYKKLTPNAFRFTYQNLKSCKPHEKQNKKHQNATSICKKLKTKGLMFFVSFFHVICKISKFNKRTAKYFAQASRTELTLITSTFKWPSISNYYWPTIFLYLPPVLHWIEFKLQSLALLYIGFALK